MITFSESELLFVFVSSVSHHHAFSSRLDHGFVVTLDDLVVAGQSESLRVFARSDEGAASDDDYPDDTPWSGFPVASLGGFHPGEGAGAARQLGQGFLIFENSTDQAMRGAAGIHRAGGTIRAVAVLRPVALSFTLGTTGPAAHGFAGSLSGAFVGAFMGAFAFGHASGATGLAGAGSAGRIIGLAWGRHRALLAGLKSRGISWSVTEGSQR